MKDYFRQIYSLPVRLSVY